MSQSCKIKFLSISQLKQLLLQETRPQSKMKTSYRHFVDMLKPIIRKTHESIQLIIYIHNSFHININHRNLGKSWYINILCLLPAKLSPMKRNHIYNTLYIFAAESKKFLAEQETRCESFTTKSVVFSLQQKEYPIFHLS